MKEEDFDNLPIIVQLLMIIFIWHKLDTEHPPFTMTLGIKTASDSSSYYIITGFSADFYILQAVSYSQNSDSRLCIASNTCNFNCARNTVF